MARIRTIKPEFPQSESMGRVSRDARLLFILLWTLADDAGRLRGNSRMLASLLFPYDELSTDAIDEWLISLESEGCILRYSVDGTSYVQICNWLDHQKIDKPSKSKTPPPPCLLGSCGEDSRALVDDSRALVLGREGKGMDQGKDQGPAEEESAAAANSRLSVTDIRFLYSKCFGSQMPPGTANLAVELCGRFSADAINRAFEEAAVYNKPSMAYVRGILTGVKKDAEIKSSDNEFARYMREKSEGVPVHDS